MNEGIRDTLRNISNTLDEYATITKSLLNALWLYDECQQENLDGLRNGFPVDWFLNRSEMAQGSLDLIIQTFPGIQDTLSKASEDIMKLCSKEGHHENFNCNAPR